MKVCRAFAETGLRSDIQLVNESSGAAGAPPPALQRHGPVAASLTLLHVGFPRPPIAQQRSHVQRTDLAIVFMNAFLRMTSACQGGTRVAAKPSAWSLTSYGHARFCHHENNDLL